ncbi:MAG: nuclear transport factor 2 family protein [Myxococcaceae bacterium]
MRWLMLLVAVGFLGCVKAPPPKPKAEKIVLEPLEEVRETVEEAFKAVESGDSDRIEPLFSDDALVLGLGPSDTWSGSVVVGERARQALLPIGLAGDTIKFEDSKIVIGLAPGDQAAWAFDLPKVTTTHKGKSAVWLPRVTMHLIKDGKWKIDALHVSLAVPDALVSAPDATKKLVAPSDVTNDRNADSDQIVGVVKRSLEDYGVKVDRSSERAEFVQLGTSAAEVFIGGKAFKDLLKPQVGAIKKAGYTWKIDGNLRVKLAPGGHSGWAAAIVVQRSGSGKKAQTYPAFRYLWTLVEEDGVWNITSEHQSLAVKEDLRDPATDDQLKTWQATRDLAEKTMAKSRSTAKKPSKTDAKADSGGDDKPPKKDDKKDEKKDEKKDADIGAW